MNMTLVEATNLAALIHSDERFVVIAIGRFLLVEELSQPEASDKPWGLTVMPRDNPSRRATLWSPEQWTEYRELVIEELGLAAVARPSSVARPSQAVANQPAAARPRKAEPLKAEPLKAEPHGIIPVSPTESQILLF